MCIGPLLDILHAAALDEFSQTVPFLAVHAPTRQTHLTDPVVHDLKRSYVLFLVLCGFAHATCLHQLVKDGAKGTLPMKIDSQVHGQIVFYVKGEKVGSKASFTLAQYEFVDQGSQPMLHRQVQHGAPQSVATLYVVERSAQITLGCH